jgi:hypothetical protein
MVEKVFLTRFYYISILNIFFSIESKIYHILDRMRRLMNFSSFLPNCKIHLVYQVQILRFEINALNNIKYFLKIKIVVKENLVFD